MSWSLEMGRLLGVPVRVHVTFLLVPVLGAIHWAPTHGARGALFGAVAALAVFACVVLHELGHSWAARRVGIGTKQILLLPIGGLAELDGQPKKPGHELLIALAGPMVNLVIAAVLALALGGALALGWLDQPALTSLEPSAVTLAVVLMGSNVVLALFNLLPFFPLDGGRVLRAVLAFRLDKHHASRIAAGVGQVGALLIGVIALLQGQAVLGLVALFLFLSASAAKAQATVPGLLAGLEAKDACEQGPVVLEPGTHASELSRLMMTSGQSVFPVALGTTVVGVIAREGFALKLARERSSHASGLMSRSWLRVDAHAPLHEVLEQLASERSKVAAVYEADALLGFLTAEHVLTNVLPLAAQRRVGGAPGRTHEAA